MSQTIEKYVIRFTSGSEANQTKEFDFGKQTLTFGRDPKNDIIFDPERDLAVSREHGKIVKKDDNCFIIEDFGSRNGTFVNGNKVNGAILLNPGDEVRLGENGPAFIFDLWPKPAHFIAATRVMNVPSAKATAVAEIIEPELPASIKPPKQGIGKNTMERMLVSERKKSYSNIGIAAAVLILLAGGLLYAFKDKMLPAPVNKTTTVVMKDSTNINKKSPDQIAAENTDRVVQIEFGWQLYNASTSDEVWHLFTQVKNGDGTTRMAPVFIQNASGGIEPYIDDKKNVSTGMPIGVAGSRGTGFVVSQDGFILTNRHVGASWNTRYNAIGSLPQQLWPGILVKAGPKGPEVVKDAQVMPKDVFGWVPAKATMLGGRQVPPGTIKGRNTFMNVIFAGTALRRPVQSSTPSDNHDVALIKVELPQALSPVKMKDLHDQIKPGQAVTVMGYPAIAAEMYTVRKSNDPFNPTPEYNSVPTPTITPGAIGRVVQGSSEKDDRFSAFGDSYQLTINATGGGNSGGPMFDDEGNVIGIYYAGSSSNGTAISYAVPIKYGLELMGPIKVAGVK